MMHFSSAERLDALTVADRIHMPAPMTAMLERFRPWYESHDSVQDSAAQLTNPHGWTAAKDELDVVLPGGDAQAEGYGVGMLYCMLSAAGIVHERYRSMGIGEDAFDATMGCFTRFVCEHHRWYGTWGFDRAFWTGRETSMLLFRIGTLEYEMIDGSSAMPDALARRLPETAGGLSISMHIPSDADLRVERCMESIQRARLFFGRHFPAYADAPYWCESWLLSPQLDGLLGSESHILAFQRLFDIVGAQRSEDYRVWVYDNDQAPAARLPERTSLQRSMKDHLLAGGRIDNGIGLLRESWPGAVR